MKKITFVLTMLYAFVSNAQFEQMYDDINLGSSDIPSLCGPSNNWMATHGSPSYTANATTLYMWDGIENPNGHIGEGVCRIANIKPNTDYIIDIGIYSFDLVNQYNEGVFSVYLVNSFQQNCAQGAISGSSVPSFPSSRLLYEHTSGTSLSNETLNLRFSTGPNESYTGIVIYPYMTTHYLSHISLIIDCLGIMSCGNNSDKYYCDSYIPFGEYYQKNAYIGSSYCSNATSTASITNRTTLMHAYETIDIKSNTILSVQQGTANIISLDIVPKCFDGAFPLNLSNGAVVANIYNNSCGSGNASKPNSIRNNEVDFYELEHLRKNAINRLSNLNVSLSPNPSKEILNINYNLESESKVMINIRDLSGRTVETKSFNSQEKGDQKITLDISKLYSGTYFLEFTTINGKVTNKFVVTK